MKSRYLLPIVLLLTCLATRDAFAGDTLSIRLIEASNVANGKVDSGLEDVAHAMKSMLTNFNNYHLVASNSQQVPVKNTTIVLGEYTVKCSGKQKSMKIYVYRGSKLVTHTPKGTYLQDNKPFILAGLLGSKTGSLMLVFVVR